MYIIQRLEFHAVDHCTQACKYCSHASNIAEKKSYFSWHYKKWIELLHQMGFEFDEICVSGGEPFLAHNLPDMLKVGNQYAKETSCITNGFWINRWYLPKYSDSMRRINILLVTLYKPIVDGMGGIENVHKYLDSMREYYKHCNITHFIPHVIETFGRTGFHKDVHPVVNTRCNFRKCLQLYDNGTLSRCCAVRQPMIDKSIDLSKVSDVFFDLKQEFSPQELIGWLEDPIPKICEHCLIATEGEKEEIWENERT